MHRTICATDIKVRITETLFYCPDRIIIHVVTLFCRSQVHQLHDFAVHHLMVPQSAEWRADNTDSRISDEIVGDEFAVAQKILAIFVIDSVHTVLQR